MDVTVTPGSAIDAGVAAVFGAVVGVLGSIVAFSPRVRALERDAAAGDAMRRSEREADGKLLRVELGHLKEQQDRQFAELRLAIDVHAARSAKEGKGNERREIVILQLLAEVAGKLKVNHRLSDALTNILTAAEREASEKGP